MSRVKYLKSTLREVIFQIRFPKILKLTEEAPARFQELLNVDYPIYNVRQNETRLEINGAPRQQLNEKNHEFITSSGKTKVNITSSFAAISTLEYERWEKFREEAKSVFERFFLCYSVPGIQRIGLRYQNVVSRSALGLEGVPWSTLLKADVIGPLSGDENIVNYETVFEIQNGDQCFTRRHFQLVRELGIKDFSMLLDCDYYYTGFYSRDAVLGQADKLHTLSQAFINGSHSALLLEAMHPQELEPWKTS